MIETDALYPLVFTPVYKEVMWGGNKLETILNREIPPHSEPVGESWEIVDRDDAVSTVENGPLKGCTLRQLVEYYGKDLVGRSFNGGKFPLLVKLIDAGKRLSLQVHPDEAACSRTPGIEPKTEMWYIIHADKGAKIIAGLRNDTTKMRFLQNISTQEVESTLQIFDSVPGDAYFIKAGKVHAIGAGNLLLEIQQNSNLPNQRLGTRRRKRKIQRTSSGRRPRVHRLHRPHRAENHRALRLHGAQPEISGGQHLSVLQGGGPAARRKLARHHIHKRQLPYHHRNQRTGDRRTG